MTDAAHHARLRTQFGALLHELDGVWPQAALADLREDLSHDEFGEALENLIALALRPHHPLSPSARAEIEDLAAAMGLADLPALTTLRGRGA